MMLDKEIVMEVKKMSKKIAEYKIPKDYIIVKQTEYYPKQQNLNSHGAGDCLKTCIAYVTQTHWIYTPNFAEFAILSGEHWTVVLKRWLNHFDLDIIGDDEPDKQFLTIAIGASPRGDCNHAIVIDVQHKKVYDPHPSDLMLKTFEAFFIIIPKEKNAS